MRQLNYLFAVASGCCLTFTAAAEPVSSSRSLSVAQAENLANLPICSKSLKTNCRKRDRSGWIIIGAIGAVGGVGAALTGGGKKPASP